jgi:hypothetical protein|tara:strand:+ start:537 stop:743 length:207 start_codon:yes stop_codon:yes gene_type:complete
MNDELYKEYLDEAAEARMEGNHDFPRWLDWLLLRNDPDAYAQQLRERDEDRYMARKQSAESFGHPDDY